MGRALPASGSPFAALLRLLPITLVVLLVVASLALHAAAAAPSNDPGGGEPTASLPTTPATPPRSTPPLPVARRTAPENGSTISITRDDNRVDRGDVSTANASAGDNLVDSTLHDGSLEEGTPVGYYSGPATIDRERRHPATPPVVEPGPVLDAEFLPSPSHHLNGSSELMAYYATEPATLPLHVNASDDDVVTIHADRMNASTLVETFGGTQTADGGTRVALPENGTIVGTLPARFVCRLGEHTFSVTGEQTGETDRETLTLTKVSTWLARSIDGERFAVRSGETVRVPVELACGERWTLAVAPNDIPENQLYDRGNYLLEANATADDDNPYGAFFLDTGPTGSDATVPVSSGGTAENVTTRLSAAVRDRGIAPGTYTLALRLQHDIFDTATLTVLEQNASVAARFEDDTVVSEPPTTNASLAVHSTTGDEVLLAAEGLDATDLQSVTDGDVTEDGLLVSVPPDGTVPLRVPPDVLCKLGPQQGNPAGNATFTVTNPETGDRDTATLRIARPAVPTQWIVEDAVLAGHSENATLRIRQDELACADELWVVVERDDGASVVNATVVDANDDGRIELRLDTARLSRSTESAVDAAQPDVVESTKPGAMAGRESLPNGTYHVRIHQDVAQLRIGESPTETVTSTVTPSTTAASTATTSTVTPSTATTSTVTPSTATTSATGPGFTVVVTVLALLAAALVALGRRHE